MMSVTPETKHTHSLGACFWYSKEIPDIKFPVIVITHKTDVPMQRVNRGTIYL